jgi:peptidoglycan/LPS O-acetylase OafA/YrhL
MAAGRYLRLAVPIFVICAITYVLLNVIPPPAQRPSPLDVFGNFTPTVQGLLELSLFSAYVSQSTAGSYNPPLWTMFYEFLGSFMVFATIAILRPLHLRTWLLGFLFAISCGGPAVFRVVYRREYSSPICSGRSKIGNPAILLVRFCAAQGFS